MENLVPNQADARNAAPSFSRNAFFSDFGVRSSLEPKRRVQISNVERARRREPFPKKRDWRCASFSTYCAFVTIFSDEPPPRIIPESVQALKRRTAVCHGRRFFPDRRAPLPLSRRGWARTRIHHVHPPYFRQDGAGESVRRVRARERCAPGRDAPPRDVHEPHRLPRAPDIPRARVGLPRAVRDQDAWADVPHLPVEGVHSHERVSAQVLQPQGVQVRTRHAVRAVHRGVPRISGKEKAPLFAAIYASRGCFTRDDRRGRRRGIETRRGKRGGGLALHVRVGASEPLPRRALPPPRARLPRVRHGFVQRQAVAPKCSEAPKDSLCTWNRHERDSFFRQTASARRREGGV